MGPRDLQAEDRVEQIKTRLGVRAWNHQQGLPMVDNDNLLDDTRWLLAERERLVGIIRIYTQAKH
jgi:hypothetical protein